MESSFANRLKKNARHLRRWAAREGLEAYRVYDRDIPEWPYVVDWYAGRVHLVELPRRKERNAPSPPQREEVLRTVAEVLEVPLGRIFVKTHTPHPWGKSQYGRTGEGSEAFVVREQGLRFEVNLGDYLDTGLFLDHRRTRARVRDEAHGKRFLNLFGYTGSFTVYAAAGGAKETTTVDLSAPYLGWARRNLILNGLDGPQHRFVRADVRGWLDEERTRPSRYELIVLDPPSFSTSKRMKGTLDIQRDHPHLIGGALALLAPGGVLYFSSNFRGLAFSPPREAACEELTPRSLPADFHQKDIHRLWRITA